MSSFFTAIILLYAALSLAGENVTNWYFFAEAIVKLSFLLHMEIPFAIYGTHRERLLKHHPLIAEIDAAHTTKQTNRNDLHP